MSTECESLNMKTDYYDDDDDVWRVLKSLFLEQTHKDVQFLLLDVFEGWQKVEIFLRISKMRKKKKRRRRRRLIRSPF